MAGSYGHVRPVVRGEDDHRGSWSLIENMGDAHECVEELLWLVLDLARIIAASNGEGANPKLTTLDNIIEAELNERFVPQYNREMPQDYIFRAVQAVMSDVSPLDVDELTARRASRDIAAAAEKAAEEKIRAMVRDEIAKAIRRHGLEKE